MQEKLNKTIENERKEFLDHMQLLSSENLRHGLLLQLVETAKVFQIKEENWNCYLICILPLDL